jgi:hypothetical protein
MKARYVAVGVLIAPALSAILLWWAGGPFFVAYRAAKIAGDRPYCILVSNHDKYSNDLYEMVSRRSQLSFPRLTAKLENSGGSRGLYYTTNYALLVLDQPREYLNWSFRALDFRHDALIKIVHGIHDNKEVSFMQLKSCTPKPSFVETLK